MYLGNHLGVLEFTTTINSMLGTSMSYLNLLNVTGATVTLTNNGYLTNPITIFNTATQIVQYSAVTNPYKNGAFNGSNPATKAANAFTITGLFGRDGTQANLSPNSNPWYLYFKSNTQNRFYGTSGYAVTFVITGGLYYTACGMPGSCSISYAGNGNVKVTWTAGSGGTNNSINGYYVYLSTSSGGGAISGKAATTGSSTLTYTFSGITQTTVYAAVRTQGTAGSSYYSGYRWSGALSKPGAHPTVSAGSVITKAQMDSLRTYKAAGTAVTQGGSITASVGSTYKSVSAGTIVYASWYNGA